MSAVAPLGVIGRWRYFGRNCASVPQIENVEHASLLLDMHQEHGHTCMVYVAALGYASVVME
ncbi:hypothetical protein DFR70_11154 [Nocardia tenerifensis]|uniref:Uncharacterized protein n=1 Tax=Nocardia tenerifensis TaxID=228006 RepID=A0A318KH06_9NOCA|nr:hypothetical protein [Nocardia tenerifensis]PXX59672.1 hypothetical protein DFR70_11154 [Nocardia tenerifensis]